MGNFSYFYEKKMYRFFESEKKKSLGGFQILATMNIATVNIHREGNDTPLQYSCLENPMGAGAW